MDTEQLSPHFRLSEFTRSDTARKLKLDNTPPPEAVDALRALCVEVLEPLREMLGDKAIKILSGYRCEDLNDAVGGASTSSHLKGEAADIEVPGLANDYLFETLRTSGLAFDQLIAEYLIDGDDEAGWVHVSHRQNNRHQVFGIGLGEK